MAGYSSRSLSDKFGIRQGQVVQISHEPHDVDLLALLEPLPASVQLRRRSSARPRDFVLCFVESRKDVETRLPNASQAIPKSGVIWMLWPKKSSQRFRDGSRDVSEDVVRRAALDLGLVDVKVCAVDDTWSGLKLVWRLSNR